MPSSAGPGAFCPRGTWSSCIPCPKFLPPHEHTRGPQKGTLHEHVRGPQKGTLGERITRTRCTHTHTHTHTYKRACSSQPATRAAATPGSMTARPGLLASSQQFSSPSPFGVRAGRARQSSGLVGASIPSPGALVRAARAAGRCNCTGLCIDSFPDALVRAARAAGCFSCIRLCKFSFACARPTSTAGKCQGLH